MSQRPRVENLENEKSWKSEKSNHDIVMNEKFAKNVVMNEEFVKDSVMNAKIRSEGCDGPIHIQNWWTEQLTARQQTFI